MQVFHLTHFESCFWKTSNRLFVNSSPSAKWFKLLPCWGWARPSANPEAVHLAKCCNLTTNKKHSNNFRHSAWNDMVVATTHHVRLWLIYTYFFSVFVASVLPTVLYIYLSVSSWGRSCVNCWHVSTIKIQSAENDPSCHCGWAILWVYSLFSCLSRNRWWYETLLHPNATSTPLRLAELRAGKMIFTTNRRIFSGQKRPWS